MEVHLDQIVKTNETEFTYLLRFPCVRRVTWQCFEAAETTRLGTCCEVDPEIMQKPAEQFDNIIIKKNADVFNLRLDCRKIISGISLTEVLDYRAMAGIAAYHIREHRLVGLDIKRHSELAFLRIPLPYKEYGEAAQRAGLRSGQAAAVACCGDSTRVGSCPARAGR